MSVPSRFRGSVPVNQCRPYSVQPLTHLACDAADLGIGGHLQHREAFCLRRVGHCRDACGKVRPSSLQLKPELGPSGETETGGG